MRWVERSLAALLLVILGAAVQAAIEFEEVIQFLTKYLGLIAASVLAGIVVLGLLLWVGYTLIVKQAQKKIGKAGPMSSEGELVVGIWEQIANPKDLSRERSQALIVSLGVWLLRRETRQFYLTTVVGLVGGVIGTMTLMLLYQQNKLLQDQNHRLILQTDSNVTQSLLLESSRRATQSSELSDLLENIRSEPLAAKQEDRQCSAELIVDCWAKGGLNDNPYALNAENMLTHFVPGPLLEERIRAFARRSTPYLLATPPTAAVDFDVPLREQFEFVSLSPERGQLFQALGQSKVAISGVDFSFAQLWNLRAASQDLSGVNLIGSDIRNGRLSNILLSNSQLDRASLTNSQLEQVNMDGASLRRAEMQLASLQHSQLNNTTFDGANLGKSRFDNVVMEFANLKRTNLTDAQFFTANLAASSFQYANLKDAFFQNVTLNYANFENAYVGGAIFRDPLDFDETTSFEGAWYWHDDPPLELSDGIEVRSCRFDPARHTRNAAPSDCGLDLQYAILYNACLETDSDPRYISAECG